MAGIPQPRLRGFQFSLALLLLGFPLAVRPQTASTPAGRDGTSSDALTSLNQVLQSYAQASSYHIESIEETHINGEFSHLWTKSLATSIVGASNQYRFETRGDQGGGMQISDGKTEWIYYAPFHQYIQHSAPPAGPSRDPGTFGHSDLYSLIRAQNALKIFSGVQTLVNTAMYAPDESIEVNGKIIPCTVIKTEGKLRGISAHITTSFIFWIDKQTKLIRKMAERREGPLRPTEPETNYVMERSILFPVADLSVTSFPDGTFTFKPPVTASLVKEFEDRVSAGVRELVGKPAPALNLKGADGKEVSLQSFQGKPVLLDFWATWCVPCVESLPAIEKLYRETADEGLIVLSVDEDEEPKKAADFWSAHREPWPNFHASLEMIHQFPEHGIPYFVLIDASGKVIFSHSGFDDSGLRAALAGLGPAFASLSKATSP